MSRGNFLWEIRAAMLMPAALACADGNVVGVIAAKAFITPDMPAWTTYAITAITSASSIGLLTSPFWSATIHGRDRVRCTNVFQVGVALCIIALACTPTTLHGLLALVALTLLARSLITGILTARSDIWRANYPRTQRAFAIGRLAVVTAFGIGAAGLAIAAVMDIPSLRGEGFRIVYVACAACALIAAWMFSHVRWRGRVEHIARERHDETGAATYPGPRTMFRVLRNDHNYRRFMIAQFLLGAPNLAATPLFIIALKDHFSFNYTQSILLTQAIPIIVPVLCIPLWSKLLDRVHIVHFRAYHSWTFVVANALLGIGFITGSLPVLFLSRVALGIGFGGGMLAWELGHHDFASREMANVYMGIHATLTGVRGLIAPFVFTFLYLKIRAIPSISLFGATYTDLGPWTFFLLTAIGIYASMQFVRMHLELRTKQPTHARREPDAD